MDFSSRDGGPLFVTQSGNDTASYIVCKRLSPEIAWVEWRWAYDQTVRADDWTQDILVMVAQQPLGGDVGHCDGVQRRRRCGLCVAAVT